MAQVRTHCITRQRVILSISSKFKHFQTLKIKFDECCTCLRYYAIEHAEKHQDFRFFLDMFFQGLHLSESCKNFQVLFRWHFSDEKVQDPCSDFIFIYERKIIQSTFRFVFENQMCTLSKLHDQYFLSPNCCEFPVECV